MRTKSCRTKHLNFFEGDENYLGHRCLIRRRKRSICRQARKASGSLSFRVRRAPSLLQLPTSTLPLSTSLFSFASTLFIMEVLLGITGKDFTLVAASKAAMRGVTILKATDDKTRALNQHNLMAYSGEAGDTGELLFSCPQSLIAGHCTDELDLQCNSQSTSKPTCSSIRCATALNWVHLP